MEVTFLYHSAFLVEGERADLLFDSFRGAKVPEGDKPLLVFGSHGHRDHFSEQTFDAGKVRSNAWFVLASDIDPDRVPKQWRERTIFVKSRETHTLPGEVTVETLASTDSGVAFLVTLDGKTIYHAGDLNDWYWIGEPDRDNEVMTRKYRREIDRMSGRTLDVAFVVLDGRQESEYDRGMNYLLEHVAVGHVFPMHCWKDYSWIRKYRAEHPDLTGKTCFHEITGEGEHFSVSLGRTGSECSCKKNEKESTS